MAERKKLGELLLEAKIINATQLQSAIAHQRQWGVRLGTALIEKGFVDEATLAKFLGQQRGMQSVTLSGMKVAPEVLKRIPKELQEKHLAVPIAVEKLNNRETLVIAMVDPSNLQALDEIKFAIGATRTRYVIAVEAAVKKLILGDTRAFRPPVNAPATPAPIETPQETTGEFQIVRGTVESTVQSKPQPAPPASPSSATRTPARGVESQPVGEAMLDLDIEPEITDFEPAELDGASLEPIITKVGPAPAAAAPPAPAGGDPFLDALRGPPRSAAASVPAATAPAPRPSAPPAPAPAWPPAAEPSVAAPAAPVAPPRPSWPVTPSAPVVPPAVSLFDAPDEDRTERDLPVATPQPPPIPEMPVESVDTAPFAETVVPAPPSDPWANSPASDPWPENKSVDPPFEPIAETAPWPPNGGGLEAASEAPDTQPGAVPGSLDSTDLGPGAVPVLASGVSPFEASVPEISLPGPEMPPGMPATRVGTFDHDTSPETDAGPGGMFAIPSELEVQEGSMPGMMRAPAAPAAPEEPAAPPAWGAEPGLEATAADEPYPPVEDGFAPDTTVSPPPSIERTENEMPVESMLNTSVMPPVFQTDPTAPETEIDVPPAPSAPEGEAPVSSSAGMVPDFTQSEPQDNADATRVGSGHNEPVWDAPMEFTAPPEGSVVAEAPPDRPLPGPAVNIRPDHDDERQSVTRESPFPRGTEFDRAPAMLSARHVEEPGPAPEAPGMTEASGAGVPMSEPALEGTPPTKQSDSIPGPVVRVPGDDAPPPPPPAAVATPAPIPTPPPPPVAKEATPPSSPDLSSTGSVAAAAAASASEEQAALNALVTKKLKLLNAITEILLEKGLITEDEIKEKIAKKKG